MTGLPAQLSFVLLCGESMTDEAENRQVVDADGPSVPQQAEGFSAEHHATRSGPPLGNAGKTDKGPSKEKMSYAKSCSR